MRKSAAFLLTLALSPIFLLVVFSSSLPAVHAATSTGESLGPGIITIRLETELNPNYDAFGSGSSAVVASVTASFDNLTRSIPVELISSFKPSRVTGSTIVNGANTTLLVQVSSGKFGSAFGYDFVVPQNTTEFIVTITGTQAGTAFLGRYVSSSPFLITRGLSVQQDYAATLTVPSGSLISQVYDSTGAPLPLSTVALTAVGISRETYVINGPVGLVVLQPRIFVSVSIAITAMAVVIVVLAALNTFPSGRKLILRGVGIFTRIPIPRVAKGGLAQARLRISLRRIFRPRKLLALFIVCSVFMVAVGSIAGPDPRVKAYVIADPTNVDGIQKTVHSLTGNTLALTPAEDYGDFATMSSVGEFYIVVVSNYPPLALQIVGKYILPSLGNVQLIIIDKTADPAFAAQIMDLYPNTAVTVGDASNLTVPETQLLNSLISGAVRTNPLGLHVSNAGFRLVLALEAVLSFALIFLGWAFLGSLASESTTRTDLSHLFTVISSGVFVFVFSEVIYVVTSSLLSVPLSLHAVVSGASNVTAVGLLGFGGGSTPRLAAGFLGLLAGLLLTEGGPRLHIGDFALIVGIMLVLLASPFFLGQFAFQGALLFVSSFGFGAAFQSSLSFKSFLYGVGTALGGGVTPVYLLSAGKILYFVGLVPFAYLKKMGRTTMALAGLFAGFLIGDGGVRVGEMTPDKTVSAIVPGIVAGFAILIVLLALARIEKYVRGNWRT